MPTIYFGTVSKKVNSTYQPTLSASYDCILKDGTSIDRPSLLIQDANFSIAYNYAKWDNNYYFITDIVSVCQDVWEVSCDLDVLATYKTEITGSTQFVSYSSYNSSIWLPDTRIPLKNNPTVSRSSATAAYFGGAGAYILSFVGQNGCRLVSLTPAMLNDLLQDLTTWSNDLVTDFMSGADFTTIEKALESLSKVMSRSGAVGNAWENAPNCIRSCIWVPFNVSAAQDGSPITIWLGGFETTIIAPKMTSSPVTGSITISIPWQTSDWRRITCEDIYLYIPLVGNISIPSENIAHVTALTIKYAYTVTDGAITFEVLAGTEVIGTYGASCSASIPIGINQQNGANQMINALSSGLQKMSSASVLGVAAGVAGTAYDVANVSMSRNLTCVGGIGGGAGSGLDQTVYCTSVLHDTIVAPSSMLATMGLPTMTPMSLSTLTGYCQCANAHVAAPAQESVLAKIDAFLNTGFYIE